MKIIDGGQILNGCEREVVKMFNDLRACDEGYSIADDATEALRIGAKAFPGWADSPEFVAYLSMGTLILVDGELVPTSEEVGQ